ncbi:MAG TPA: hypothetical protein VFX12_02455 [Vicinamibacterales bacterium]|nr:hypothetical protein [Vicinamibacterales bacterium]
MLLHLLREDLRHFRWPLVMWCAVVAAEAVATAVAPQTAGNEPLYAAVSTLGWVLYDALLLAMLFLVPIIVQAHPAVGSEAFWLTRPVPRQTVWLEKSVLLGAFMVVVPVAAQMILMATSRIPFAEAVRVATETAVARALLVAALMAFASTTASLPRFALALAAAVGAFLVWAVGSITLMELRGPSEPPAAVALPHLPNTMLPVYLELGLAVGLVLAAALQYLTRLRRIAVPAAAIAIVASFFGVDYLPEVRPPAPPTWTASTDRGRLVMRSPQLTFDRASAWPEGRDAWGGAVADIGVSDLPGGWIAELTLLDGSFTRPDGTTIEGRGFGSSLAGTSSMSFTPSSLLAMRELLGVERVVMRLPGSEGRVPALYARAADLQTAASATGRYQGRFAVSLTRLQVVRVLPLRTGAAFQDGSYRFTIADLDTAMGRSLRAGVIRASSALDSAPAPTFEFCARNRARSEAVLGWLTSASGYVPGIPGVSFGTFSRTGLQMEAADVVFQVPASEETPSITLDAAWFSQADLVVIRETFDGVIVRTLDVPHVRLDVR